MTDQTPDNIFESPVETTIIPPTRDLGDGFTVRRALPSSN